MAMGRRGRLDDALVEGPDPRVRLGLQAGAERRGRPGGRSLKRDEIGHLPPYRQDRVSPAAAPALARPRAEDRRASISCSRHSPRHGAFISSMPRRLDGSVLPEHGGIVARDASESHIYQWAAPPRINTRLIWLRRSHYWRSPRSIRRWGRWTTTCVVAGVDRARSKGCALARPALSPASPGIRPRTSSSAGLSGGCTRGGRRICSRVEVMSPWWASRNGERPLSTPDLRPADRPPPSPGPQLARGAPRRRGAWDLPEVRSSPELRGLRRAPILRARRAAALSRSDGAVVGPDRLRGPLVPAARGGRGGSRRELIVNSSASPYHRSEVMPASEMVAERARGNGAAFALVQHGRGQDELVFDGAQRRDRRRRRRARPRAAIRRELLVCDLPLARSATGPVTARRVRPQAGRWRMQLRGRRPGGHVERLAAPLGRGRRGHCRARPGRSRLRREERLRDVVLALSGGIDSALVALLAADALGPERVMRRRHALALLLGAEPQADASTIAANLGIDLIQMPIAEAMPPTPRRWRAASRARARAGRGEPPGADPGQPGDGAVEQVRLAGAHDRQQERDVGRLRDALRRHGRRLRGDQGRAQDARLPPGPLAHRAARAASSCPPRCSSGRRRPSCARTSSTRTRCRPTTSSTGSSRDTSSATGSPEALVAEGLPRTSSERSSAWWIGPSTSAARRHRGSGSPRRPSGATGACRLPTGSARSGRSPLVAARFARRSSSAPRRRPGPRRCSARRPRSRWCVPRCRGRAPALTWPSKIGRKKVALFAWPIATMPSSGTALVEWRRGDGLGQGSETPPCTIHKAANGPASPRSGPRASSGSRSIHSFRSTPRSRRAQYQAHH